VTPIRKPQPLVFQDITPGAASLQKTLYATITGPVGVLVRHDVASERASGLLGEYDPDIDTAYSWPGKPAGASVDQGYTGLTIENARLRTFQDLIGSDDVVAPVAGKPNRVRIDNATYGFKANGADYPRFAALGDRDVAVGDFVTIRGVASSVNYDLTTRVTAIVADQVASSRGDATADAGNHATQVASSTITQTAGEVNCNELAVSLTGYNALADGVLDDVYTISVLRGSVNNDLSTATLRLISASGLDDVMSFSPAFVDDMVTVGSRGLAIGFTCAGHGANSISLDDLVVGQTWQVTVHDNYTAVVGMSSGTYTGTVDADYIVTCVRGGLFADALPPQIKVTTTTGVDVSGPTTVTGTAVAFNVGTKGLRITFAAGPLGIRKGDAWHIAATAATNGRYGTLVLASNLPTAIQSASDLDLTIGIQKTLVVAKNREGHEPLVNWTTSATEFTVNAGIIAKDVTATDGGVPLELPVIGGKLYVTARYWAADLCSELTSISDIAELIATIPGPLDPDNPLKYAAAKALGASAGVAVLVVGVCNPDDDDSWADALAVLDSTSLPYNLVPLTTRSSVLAMFNAHIDNKSSAYKAKWRAGFFPLTSETKKVVSSAATSTNDAVLLGTIADDPDTSGTQYTILTIPAGNAQFDTDGVRAGDIVRALYSTSWDVETWTEFTVDSVISEESLRLVAGPATAVSTPQRIEVWRNLSLDEEIAVIGAQAAAYGSRRIVAVWPDTIEAGGVSVAGYYLCAALAGLRSGVVEQQGLTATTVPGFDSTARTDRFNDTQLDTLAGYGVWTVGRNEDQAIVTRHALTTDPSTLKLREEVIRVVTDSVSYTMHTWYKPYTGKSNLSAELLNRFYVEFNAVRSYLIARNKTLLLGGELADLTLESLEIDPLQADTLVMSVTPVFNYPLNYPTIHIII